MSDSEMDEVEVRVRPFVRELAFTRCIFGLLAATHFCLAVVVVVAWRGFGWALVNAAAGVFYVVAAATTSSCVRLDDGKYWSSSDERLIKRFRKGLDRE